MKTATEKNYKEVLSDCFHSLVETGLEKTTVRTFYKATGLAVSSFYYRFSGKDEVVLEATCQGLKNITADLFRVAVKNLDSLENLFNRFFDKADSYKKDIKLIYQVASSPVYGDALRQKSEELKSYYHEVTTLIADKLGCLADSLFPYVMLFISVIRAYVIWEDKETAQSEIRLIYEKAMALPRVDKTLH